MLAKARDARREPPSLPRVLREQAEQSAQAEPREPQGSPELRVRERELPREGVARARAVRF